MFRFFDSLVNSTALPPGQPPSGLLSFYWHFVRQAKGLFAALFLIGFTLAIIEAVVPYLIGRLVSVLSSVAREQVFETAGHLLLIMAAIVLVVRPLGTILFRLLVNHSIAVSFTTLIHWQNYWHVVRQPLAFFQDDFAGRLANRVMQTARPLRESIVAFVRAVWQIVVFGATAIGLLGTQDLRLAAPMMVWFLFYGGILAYTLPKVQVRSRETSETRSAISGKVVDTFTNMMTVKLFGRRAEDDAYIRDGFLRFQAAFAHQQQLNTLYVFCLISLNAVLLVTTGGIGVWLFSEGRVDAGTLTTAVLLTTQIIAMSGWVAFEIAGIFENIGIVQEGMKTIAQPLSQLDKPDAHPLEAGHGEIRFETVHFHYSQPHRVVDGLTLTIGAGEKIGLVGRSGAGKSTLINLLLRFYEPQSGRILIDGQDIAHVTEESLRARIAVVAQDSSLLHRSIGENILYARQDADEGMMRDAARKAQADAFIDKLVDGKGRHGFEAFVGERGVKLSGGQRQRIAIARVILKDAPILLLDEATSSLDSQVEAAIQEALAALMRGRTVIAIAHRLSTLQLMDRLVVMDAGRIVEQGTHADLLAAGGLYADLWAHQSGGFIVPQRPQASRKP
ncbi:ABC transporter ATP-binding protein [Bosea sp. PAMC 26642]|uniref:ABC transporter ATP-binding protein n=1 Tax=Bosea sp. (strain PAMC 26642) TaxID=1792307 RepID=UPI00076FF896|nr:ABC transporter ATP-binding protein [Bosea sp. PAMC 26642]AMJ62440.1 multidrug ABC transporter ATP-binding protein [Bosea sp. PAMC 26642]